MRLAYVCADPGVPVFGLKGCSVHVQELVAAFLAKGIQVEIFASRPDGARPSGMEAVRVHQLPAPPKGELELRERAALAANDELQTKLLQSGPFDLVYERYSLWSHAGMMYAKSQGIPGLLEVNAPLIDEQARHRGLADRQAAEMVAKRAFTSASALIAVSQEVANYLSRYEGVAERVHVVSNGVNPDRFTPLSRETRPSTTFTIGFVGTLKPWHGLSSLIKVFCELHKSRPQARLLIVGDGPERATLEATVELQGLGSAVQLVGAVAPTEVPAYVSKMDVAVAPYPDIPGFYFSPLKVFEYMAAGLPVVTSRIGQLADLIEDDVNGILCPPGDENALLEALSRLMNDAALRQKLGRGARHTVLHAYTWMKVAEQILEIGQRHRTMECA